MGLLSTFLELCFLSYTDEEVISIYLFGIIDETTKIKPIDNDANAIDVFGFPTGQAISLLALKLRADTSVCPYNIFGRERRTEELTSKIIIHWLK